MGSPRTSEDDSQNRTSSEEISVPSAASPPLQWTSEEEDHIPLAQRQAAARAPATSPPLEWTSDEEDHIPLAQRQVAARAPATSPPSQRSPDAEDRNPSAQRSVAARVLTRRHRARAGPSSRAEAESPEGAASTIKGQDLARIRERFQVPSDVGLFLPTPDDRVTSSRPGRVAIYEICLRVGLRPPFHPFFINLLDYYSLTPAQLVPNSIRVICAFIILCFRLNVPSRVSLFRNFYTLRAQKGWWLFQPRPGRALKITLPSSIKGWKPRFFFADLPQVKPRWGNPDLRGNASPSVQPGDREALGKLLGTEVHRYTLLLTEENLYTAGVIAHLGKQPHLRLSFLSLLTLVYIVQP